MRWMSDEHLRIGVLARRAGVSVRTLHHYDALGLVSPAERTQAGHRLYAPDDVRRLYQVLAMRRLGLPLTAIASALERPDGLARAAGAQLEQVERQLAALQDVRERLRQVLSALRRGERPGGAELLPLIERMAMIESYYTPEQLRALRRRGDELGEEGMRRAEAEWQRLEQDVRAALAAEVDPASAEAGALAGRMDELIAQFTGGDAGIARSLERMYAEQGARTASRGVWDEDVAAYLQRARAAHGR